MARQSDGQQPHLPLKTALAARPFITHNPDNDQAPRADVHQPLEGAVEVGDAVPTWVGNGKR